jgi:hypothetical protein
MILSNMGKENSIDSCKCKCHFGGAVSCPSCKKNHEIHHCENCG